jgi:DNA-binding transcriptional regulator YiaG
MMKKPKKEEKRKKMIEFKIITNAPDGEKKVIKKKFADTAEILYLETSIDKLYKMLKEKNEMKIKDIAKEFDVSLETVEEWGKILEDHNLAELHYPAFGDPLIKIKKKKNKEE